MPIREGIETGVYIPRGMVYLGPKGVPIREGIETVAQGSVIWLPTQSEGVPIREVLRLPGGIVRLPT